jgi:hypothetical protein
MFVRAYSREGTGEQSSSQYPNHLNVGRHQLNRGSVGIGHLTKSGERSRMIGRPAGFARFVAASRPRVIIASLAIEGSCVIE